MATIPLQERVYAMDAKGGAIVIGTAGKQLVVYDIAKMGGKPNDLFLSIVYNSCLFLL